MSIFNETESVDLPIALALVKECREVLFNRLIKSYAHERDWEDEEQEELRERNNKKAKLAWDRETELMLQGKISIRTSYCMNDIINHINQLNKDE